MNRVSSCLFVFMCLFQTLFVFVAVFCCCRVCSIAIIGVEVGLSQLYELYVALVRSRFFVVVCCLSFGSVIIGLVDEPGVNLLVF